MLLLVALAANGSSSSRMNRAPAIKSSINGPTALALDNNGHLFVIDGEEDRIDRIDLADGTISVVAGYGRKPEQDCIHRDAIQAAKACLQYPTWLAVDAYGNLFIGEMSGYLRKVDVGSCLISGIKGLSLKQGAVAKESTEPRSALLPEEIQNLPSPRVGSMFGITRMPTETPLHHS